MISEGSLLWQYLSTPQRQLVIDGKLLIEDRKLHPYDSLSDYSYLVFPFAKLYEGFLKQLFLDLGIIKYSDYKSDHFRIGRVLSPNLVRRLGKFSAYAQIENRFSRDLAVRLWQAWKQGRNLVFHYFPHNIKALQFDDALASISLIIEAMETAVNQTQVRPDLTLARENLE